MQILKANTRNRILIVARQQFEQKGYSKTSMREIAESAGVGVGNIYNYFTNKDELFREVVRPVLYALEAMLQEHHGIRGEDIMMMRSEEYLKSCIDEYVSLMDKHSALMKILLFHAQGSSLECFCKNYTDRSTELVKNWFASMQRKHPEINTAVSDFIIHLHTVWMFTMFEELLMHAVPRQEMETILHDYFLFEIQGWRAIIKI
ncbi:helix-turn-helix domain-containing protein [uncultured Bacteroides sp.]|uniref:TetR/AcrR family transcriptional regulator n=1 Tax=uncultured Bacteroides sp. TaxID=162156 RepID=UPI00280ABA00|nr:helix-turn-helix domain-containing protein [uncultured Bacteroides sp.]